MSAKLSLAACVFLVLSACGYVGDPLPPALHIPRRIADLRVKQSGGRLIVDFTIDPLTTEALGLRLGGIELRAGSSDPGSDLDAWAATAERLDVSVLKPGPVHLEFNSASRTGKPLWFAVRIASHRERWSEWSNVETIEVVEAIPAPQGLRADVSPQGVQLSWRLPVNRAGSRVRVLRKGPDEQDFAAVADVDGDRWIDAAAQYGQTYEYAVQSFAEKAESPRTAAIRVTPEDKFAPAPPVGLSAIVGLGTVELAWEPSPEPDVAGYRVYRATGDATPQPLGEPVAAASYRDREVRSGTKYRYAVSAVDQRGNESALCAAVEVVAP